MAETTTPEPTYTQVVALPGLLYACPQCNASAALPGAKGLVMIQGGGRIRLRCSKCGEHIELWQGEQPRIVQPGQLNRQQRRAKASSKRVLI